MIWPESKRFALLVTVDVDGDLPLLAQAPGNIDRAKSRSVGLYGPEVGADRIARVLARHEITADWFVPGAIAERYPELIASLAATGHRIGAHGYAHLDFDGLDLDEQIAEMRLGRDAIGRLLGARPTGFRVPEGEWAEGFPESMAELGFAWSSSLPADDVPFPLTGTGLTEIPFRYELEDQQYLGYNLDPPFPPGLSRITPLEFVEENWQFEARGAERYGTLLHLRLNAEVMGFPGRARMLDRFLAYVLERDGVWVASCDELHELTAAADPDPRHPYALFREHASRERLEPPP